MLNNIAAITNSGAPPEIGDYQSIATTTVGGGGSASIAFNSISSSYSHLQLRIIARSTAGGSAVTAMNCSINSSVNAVRNHYVRGSTTVSAAAQVANQIGWATGTSMTASAFATAIVDILDYSNTSKNKTFRTLAGAETNSGAGDSALFSQLFDTTAAITDLTLTLTAGNFAQYSQIALYGIK